MNFIIHAWASSKRFDLPDNGDNNSYKTVKDSFDVSQETELFSQKMCYIARNNLRRIIKGRRFLSDRIRIFFYELLTRFGKDYALSFFVYIYTYVYIYSRLDRLMVIKWNFFVLFMQLIVCRIKNTWRVFREFKSGRSKNIPSYFFDENLVACIVYKHDGYALHDPFNEL